LYIGEQRVETPPAQIALMACLHEHQGRIVSYEYLGQLRDPFCPFVKGVDFEQ